MNDPTLKPEYQGRTDWLKPEYGPCNYCGVHGCYPYAHAYLTDAMALRSAKIGVKHSSGLPRYETLCAWVIQKLEGK